MPFRRIPPRLDWVGSSLLGTWEDPARPMTLTEALHKANTTLLQDWLARRDDSYEPLAEAIRTRRRRRWVDVRRRARTSKRSV